MNTALFLSRNTVYYSQKPYDIDTVLSITINHALESNPNENYLIEAFVGYGKKALLLKNKVPWCQSNCSVMHYSTGIKICMGNRNNKTAVKTILE